MAQINPALKMTAEPNSVTPMMKQYLTIKAEYPDAILFYRLGDFYEMFFDDAVTASQILDLTLTARNKKEDNPVPLCGVPYHAADAYIAKLIENGKKVVICEQMEDPKQAKGIVRREVTRVITPGTVMEEQCLDARRNNHLLCVHQNADQLACAVCDVSTGKLEYFSLGNLAQLKDAISCLEIREVIYPEFLAQKNSLPELWRHHNTLFHHSLPDLNFDPDFATDTITGYFDVQSPAALGLANDPVISVIGGLLSHLKDSKMLTRGLISQPVEKIRMDTLFLDETTVHHLELFRTQHEQKRHGTLLWHLDRCQTPMGARLLADWIRHPLQNAPKIEQRLDAVAELMATEETRDNITTTLHHIADLERLAGRFVTGSANARDAVVLADSLAQAQALKSIVQMLAAPIFTGLAGHTPDFSGLRQHILSTLVDEPPLTVREGGIIRCGVNAELDELKKIETSGKGTILELEANERAKTGITSLKVRYNSVFGYYIEITHTHRDKVPAHYIRKQTITNAERYITPELKEFETRVLGAGERIRAIEYEIFQTLRQEIATHAVAIRRTAQAVAMADVLSTLSGVAKSFHYIRPQITTHRQLDLKGARHPILERLNPGERFVPNDVNLDQNACHEMIITGPNMAGKSTLMRQVALITILSHIGSFVPCEAATIGLCDRIFTRVGAHDNLQKGLSTFMVEMIETAKILREATPQSLILLDEIGRGTSTFDGLSIAWAVAEDLHDRLKARTLFATHYHELCDLAEQKRGIKNFHMAVKEWNGEIIFLRKLKTGGTNRSYGVVVGGMAGLPPQVVKRAREILGLLEMKDLSFQKDVNAGPMPQLSLFDSRGSALLERLKNLDVNAITPIEALGILAGLKESCRSL